MGLLSVSSTPPLCNMVASYCTLVQFYINNFGCSRGSPLACPVIGVLLFNFLKALSIPRIAINPLQSKIQGKEMLSQESFFGPLCPVVITTQQPQLLSPPYSSIVSPYIQVSQNYCYF